MTNKNNFNRCDRCWDDSELTTLSFDCAVCSDTGVCGGCGELSEVYDYPLICYYLGHGLTTDNIASSLPRLRNYPDGTKYSIADISGKLELLIQDGLSQ